MLAWTDWQAYPPVVVGLIGAAATYWVIAQRFRVRTGQAVWFGAGLLTLAVALLSPIEAGADLLFTLHMVQHTLLMVLAPICLVLGLPAGFLGWVWRHRRLGPIARRAFSPAAFFAYHGVLIAWHVPLLYEATLTNALIHELEHLTFFLSGIAFWGVILAPAPALVRASEGLRVIMLIGGNLLNWLVSFTLAVADRVYYPTYASAPRLWGLSPLGDQILGAGLMWMMGQMVYGILFLLLLLRWLRRDDARGRAAGQRTAPVGDAEAPRFAPGA